MGWKKRNLRRRWTIFDVGRGARLLEQSFRQACRQLVFRMLKFADRNKRSTPPFNRRLRRPDSKQATSLETDNRQRPADNWSKGSIDQHYRPRVGCWSTGMFPKQTKLRLTDVKVKIGFESCHRYRPIRRKHDKHVPSCRLEHYRGHVTAAVTTHESRSVQVRTIVEGDIVVYAGWVGLDVHRPKVEVNYLSFWCLKKKKQNYSEINI